MYRVLIVDDESFVIKSLSLTIDWIAAGFELVGQANNGLEALDAIERLKPDLVFTDIKMPRMGGLDLIKMANERASHVLFVVISGHAEFAYVQKALNYGALGYCLKPFEDNEISSVLLKAKNKLDENKVLHEIKLMELLDDKSDWGQSEILSLFESLRFEYTKGSEILVIVCIGSAPVVMPHHIRCIQLKIGRHKYAYLLEFEQATYIKEYLVNTFPEHIKGIGMSTEPCSLDTIEQAMERVIVAASQFFVTGISGVYESRSLTAEEVNPLILQLEKAIDGKESTQIRKVLALMNDSERSRNTMDIQQAFRVYNMVMAFLYKLDIAKYEDYIYSYEQLINLFGELKLMLGDLNERLEQQMIAGRGSFNKHIRNETFKVILDLINDNFSKDISIQSIAEEYKINPKYVSQLFRKNLDLTFTEYLTKLRISYACNLLKTTNLPINQIADKAGYDEYYYFIRVFKKVTGQTPTDFRV